MQADATAMGDNTDGRRPVRRCRTLHNINFVVFVDDWYLEIRHPPNTTEIVLAPGVTAGN